MKITLDIRNLENFDALQLPKIQHIIEKVIDSGGLTGVKGGQTIIHFDHQGKFRSVQLSYHPWIERSVDS